jgi:eukaryotic translation initiation factor 2C
MDMPLEMTSSMIQTPCSNLGIPTVTYANGEECKKHNPKEDSDWIFFKRCFVKRSPNKVFKGFVLYAPDLKGSDKTVKKYMEDLPWVLQDKRPNYICKLQWVGKESLASLDHQSMNDGLQAAKLNKADFVVLILQKKNIPAHSAFKDLADRKYGFHSLCLTEAPNWTEGSTLANGTVIPGQMKKSILQYLVNVSMKMNLKANGINHEVKDLNAIFKDTLVLGADVTHPSPGCIVGCLSIAAVVGSVDDSGSKYTGSMRLQQRGNKEVRWCNSWITSNR